MNLLQRIKLNGFKSISSLDLELNSLNVLIGVNGAGKSNLVSFFKMLNEMMGGRFQQFVATSGRAQALLHFGPKVTPQIEVSLEFAVDNGTDTYSARLFHAAGDTLVFAEEKLSFLQIGWQGSAKEVAFGAGHQESRVRDEADKGEPTAKVFRHLLNQCRVFHVHDTSATARVREYCYIGDDRWLMPDAANLAAILYRLRNKDESPAYRRILTTLRRIAPFFDDFELEPSGASGKEIILNWRQKGSDQIFGPHQLSDGTLRAMALVTLLMQPVNNLPNLIVIDEPELGLHPAVKTIIAGLIKSTSEHSQIVVATQSAAFLDSFEAKDIIVVERNEKESSFARLESSKLNNWLEEYSLGELWEKNVLGGGPFS